MAGTKILPFFIQLKRCFFFGGTIQKYYVYIMEVKLTKDTNQLTTKTENNNNKINIFFCEYSGRPASGKLFDLKEIFPIFIPPPLPLSTDQLVD
jgi:hypothetical protein